MNIQNLPDSTYVKAYDKLLIIPDNGESMQPMGTFSFFSFPRHKYDYVRNILISEIENVDILKMEVDGVHLWEWKSNENKDGIFEDNKVLCPLFQNYQMYPIFKLPYVVLCIKGTSINSKKRCLFKVDWEWVNVIDFEGIWSLSLMTKSYEDFGDVKVAYQGGCLNTFSEVMFNQFMEEESEVYLGNIRCDKKTNLVCLSVYHPKIIEIVSRNFIKKSIEKMFPNGDGFFPTEPPCKDIYVKIEECDTLINLLLSIYPDIQISKKDVYEKDLIGEKKLQEIEIERFQKVYNKIINNKSLPIEEKVENIYQNEDMGRCLIYRHQQK